jgi:hypothetical protein
LLGWVNFLGKSLEWCRPFNFPNNPRVRLFLISNRADGIGIILRIGPNIRKAAREPQRTLGEVDRNALLNHCSRKASGTFFSTKGKDINC